MEIRERVEHNLEHVGLEDIGNRFPNELSTGEKKRVALARSLIINPKIILYDEPTTGMDPMICEMIDDLIVKLDGDFPKMTSVVVSHDIKATLDIAHKIIMLDKGKIILEGNREAFRTSENPKVQQFLTGEVSENSDGEVFF